MPQKSLLSTKVRIRVKLSTALLLVLAESCVRAAFAIPHNVAFHSPHCMKSFRLSTCTRVFRTQTYRARPSCSVGLGLDSSARHFSSMFQKTPNFFATVANFERLEEGDMSLSKYSPYERWVRRLYQTNLFHPVKLGLQNMQALHDAMGLPMDQRPVIHIAGTNGKGSVALKIATTLQILNPSLKIGLFCSPHVSSFRERMQINGELISEDLVVQYLPEIYDICEQKNIPATFFEVTTALAFVFFKQADVVVLETGLGGRLDATNVIAAPALSVITSIGLEHTKILGDTIELIALEKGGIIKKGRPVLVGPHCPHDVLRQCAVEKGASQYLTCDDVLGTLDAEITDYDKENARTSRAALSILQKDHPELFESVSDEMLEKGTSIRPPCRFETVEMGNNLTVILDVAHNPPAMEYLLRKLKATYPDVKYRIVVGMSADKDLSLVGKMLLDAVDASALHLVEAYHPRAAKLEDIIQAEPRLSSSNWNSDDRSITTQIKAAMKLAEEKQELLVICGSVFLMAEAREALGFDEPRDSEYIAEVAGAHFKHGQEIFANSDPEPELKEVR